MKTLQDRLIWARSQKGLQEGRSDFTQEDLATKAGVSQGSIAHLESGRTKTSRKLTAIAEALGVSARWLAEGKGKPYPSDNQPEKSEASIGESAETPASSHVITPTAREVNLIWASSEDISLLTLFHGTDDAGRAKILRTARVVPKVVAPGAIHNKPESG